MAICVFCGEDRKPSKEHVWPQWLRRYPATDALRELAREEAAPPWFAGGLEPGEDGTLKRHQRVRGTVPLLPDVTVKDVCVGCNTGWMSQLEGAVRPLLDAMINGRALSLTPRGQETLALWVTKTFMTYALTIPPPHRPFSDDDYRGLFAARQATERSRIYVGRSQSPTAQVALSVRPHLLAPHDTKPEELLTMPATVANSYLAAHGVVFLGHFFPERLAPLIDTVFAFGAERQIGLQRLWPPRAKVRWPISHIEPERLSMQHEYLSAMVDSVALPMEGLTLEQLGEVNAAFGAGASPEEAWALHPNAVDDPGRMAPLSERVRRSMQRGVWSRLPRDPEDDNDPQLP